MSTLRWSLPRRPPTRDGGTWQRVCTNDQLALGAADAIREHAAAGHARDDPVVIGVDGIEEATAVIKSGTTPLKATIVQDTQHIADAAVNLLFRLRAGQQVPAETQIPTTICATS